MIILEEILGIVHKELNIRMTLKSLVTGSKNNKKIKKKYMSCVRMMILVLFSLGCGFKRVGNIQKFSESINLANSIGETFLSKSDNLRISINKYCNQELVKVNFIHSFP